MQYTWSGLQDDDVPFSGLVLEEHPIPAASIDSTNIPALDRKGERPETALSAALAQAFFDVLCRLQDRHDAETCALHAALAAQQETLHAAVSEVREIASGFQELVRAASEQKETQSAAQQELRRLAVRLETVEQSGAQQDAALRNLRADTESLSATVATQLESVAGRLGFRDELGALKATTSEVTRRIDQLVERLDRHAAAIEGVCSHETLTETALNRFAEIWTQLRLAAGGQGPHSDLR